MFLEHYKLYWKNYANFTGRTPRSGYWFFILWDIIIGVVLSLLTYAVGIGHISQNVVGSFENPFVYAEAIGSSLLSAVGGLFVLLIVIGAWNLVNIIPKLAIIIRRLHDTGRRWFWIILQYGPIIAIIILTIILFVNAPTALFIDAAATAVTVLPIIIVILLFVSLAGSIIMLVFMCLPTSPKAIGVSTHERYPQ